MNWKKATGITGAVIFISGTSLAFHNPTLQQYHDTILAPVAAKEAERLVIPDRRAIEAEAAKLASHFAAVRYDAHRLDAATIQQKYPLLGAALSHLNESDHRTLTETLAGSREQALRRVAATREAMQYQILADLAAHTTWKSYGVWSVFSTCLDKNAFSYRGMAREFYEVVEHGCSPSSPS